MPREIPRRAFLGGTVGTAIAYAMGGTALAGASPSLYSLSDPHVPAGVQLRGVNHVGSFEQATRDTIWGGFWRTWDWANWIQPQLDDIAKVGNSVRFWGNTLAMSDGSITQAQYLARWQQALDYARSLGLLVYPCGGDLRHWGNFTWKQSTDTFTEWAKLLSNYPNVIGVDVTNEASDALRASTTKYAYQQPESAEQLLGTLGEVVRLAGLPVTHSRSIRDKDGWSVDYFTDHMGDFLDFHVYYHPGPSDSLSAYKQSLDVGKKLIIGEFGQDTKVSSAARADYYRAIRMMCSNDANCVGAFAWSAWDLNATESAEWGLFDMHRTLRNDIADVFLTFPTTS